MDLRKLRLDPVKLREARGDLPRKRVSEEVGVTSAQLCMIETGRSRPSAELLARLCVLYGVNVTDLTKRAA